MEPISVVKIDGWDGGVLAGEPEDGDLVRITYSNGTIREKIYWDITISDPPIVDQEVLLRGSIRRTIDTNTPTVIADFTYNASTYNLSESVIQQVRDLVAEIQNSDTPAAYFPVDIVVGENDSMEVVVSVGATAFKSVVMAIYAQIRTKRAEARTLKLALNSMNLAELQAWADPRL